MQNYVKSGKTLSLLAPYTVTSGQTFKVGNIIAVANEDATSGAAVEGDTEGVFALTKKSGDTFSIGDPAYWDDTDKYWTSTSSGNTKGGVCSEVAALSGDPTVTVRLNGNF